MQPARQQRSRATARRILDATRNLLRHETFDQISIRRIVKEANTSIGSFYARFRDKEALLRALYAEYETRLDEQIETLKGALLETSTLEEAAYVTAEHFVALFGEIPNLSRAAFEYATRSPRSEQARRHSDKRWAQYGFLIDRLLEHQSRITHPEPRRAVELSLYFLTVACRNRLFYPLNPQARRMDISHQSLKDELARLAVGYLTA